MVSTSESSSISITRGLDFLFAVFSIFVFVSSVPLSLRFLVFTCATAVLVDLETIIGVSQYMA